MVEDQKRAEVLLDEICFFCADKKVQVLPAYDVKPYYGLSPHRKIVIKNLELMFKLLNNDIDILICPKQALIRRCIPKTVFEGLTQTIMKNDLLDRDELIQRLIFMGYERSTLVEDPGQFALRGDVIDIFSPHQDKPYRVSLFDIEVESIKEFDPSTQLTSNNFDQIKIIPAHEIFLNYYQKKNRSPEKNDKNNFVDAFNLQWKSQLKKQADEKELTKDKRDRVEELINNKVYFHGIEFFLSLFYHNVGSLFDYLPKDSIFISDLDQSIDHFALQNLEKLTESHLESDHIESIFSPLSIFMSAKELNQKMDELSCLFSQMQTLGSIDGVINQAQDWPQVVGLTESNHVFKTQILAKVSKLHNLAPLASALNQKRLDGYRCYVVCKNQVQLERVDDLLKRFEVPLRIVEGDVRLDTIQKSLDTAEKDRIINLLVGDLHQGFISHESYQWWITDEEVFGKKTKRAVGKRHKTAVFSSFSDLSDGDYIIHLDHGVGIYHGLVKLDYDVHKNDFMLIEYLENDKLYVPIDKLNRVQRFMAEEGTIPQIDKLGGKTWGKTRDKAKRAAKKLAKELLVLQAKRDSLKGYQFSPSREQMEEFAANFEFEETPDQHLAIQDMHKDMESSKPMDRLICGDVGYGKTEVAMRGTFKALCDHKQVAILVPTTVLAFQHYTTLVERFKNYPCKIGLLSRFRTPKQLQDTVRLIQSGGVDIVVGTHRLLSKDIKFRDLGLLVVDEEHRFGVTHKENIKKLKSLVDVMTLTATPIPRTLNFALNGIRDLSIINTPPVDRLAIKTYTCYFDEITIKDAIQKEIRRGGQAYFVHNRVQSIDKITTQLKKLLPDVKFRIGHGQMSEGELEEVMIDFMNHEFDVLVCTTIIESGLDIPNANTMIVNRADNFGLAQLYQLRGRVGRSSHQAYCYLVIPLEGLLTTKAKKRLKVIQKFTELGSGFKVASHDLEIRGAGNILGDDQSGHIAAIGYDLYIHLLQEAVSELKNKDIPEDFEPEIHLNLPSKIPDEFIADQQLRLILYKQLSACDSLDAVEALQEGWEDRFG
ncbi:transcription-repair coupling factor, partial [bacterium K02(2017)]